LLVLGGEGTLVRLYLQHDIGDSLGPHGVREAAGPALQTKTRYMPGWSLPTQ